MAAENGMAGLNFQVFEKIYAGIFEKFTVIVPAAFIQGAWKSTNISCACQGYDHFIIGKNTQNSLYFRR